VIVRHGARSLVRRLTLVLVLSLSLSATANCQGHVQYTGSIERRAPDTRSAAVTLNVWSSTDSTLHGYISIAPPIGRSGEMTGWFEKDSLELLSASESGDSIRWYSSRLGAHLTGTYAVYSGAGAGQTGNWSVTLVHGTALSPPGTPPAVSVSSLRSDLPGWLLLAVTVLAFAWGFRRIWRSSNTRPVEWTFPVTDADARLRGVGGWMAWFLFAQLLSFLLALVRVTHVWTTVHGTSWSMGEVIPELRPMLAMESIANIAQLTSPIVAVVLTTRLDQRARPWWLLHLGMIFLFASLDIAAGARLLEAMPLVTGIEGAQRASVAIDTAREKNVRVLLGSATWFLYWYRSRRVRLNFGPIADKWKKGPEIAMAQAVR
jgi:hypothetical protein